LLTVARWATGAWPKVTFEVPFEMTLEVTARRTRRRRRHVLVDEIGEFFELVFA
jgi:hypothetical protein